MRLDHFAVAGASRAEAVLAVEEALGVALQPGGDHAAFGTHNALLGLADGLYLEAIAIDPAAPPPGRPRWFDLDRFAGRARLTNWICATEDLDGELAQLGHGAGHPMELARGDLSWRMAVPDSGILPFDNMFPALIEWQSPVHPSDLLAVSGCALRRLVVCHPEAEVLRRALAPLLREPRVVYETGPALLRAEIDTPNGLRVLL
ncbi:VOC family protein [Seohaeicola zhoushanensis]|uniref:Polyphosphate kinase n=1 Tax=Seohaeicola zhoushanensis TaxID=1569283 RepID=A0A8J3H2E8_9RHOB|nr:VOC family protein [Seohaeicola zhoushanensis]GHF75828.1 polyphosphate kinase [Seohaeicola zhoushanensis]